MDPKVHPVRFGAEFEPGLSSHLFRVDQMPHLDPTIGAIAGDVIGNLRASLDHTAWALVKLGPRKKLGKSQALAVQYPMAESSKGFDGQRKRRLPGVPDAQVEIIKRYQPYSRKDDGRRLAKLNALANKDKHRVVIPAVVYPANLHHRDFKATNCRIIGIQPLLSEHTALKLNAKVVRVYVVTSAPAGHISGVQMMSKLTLYPALARGVPVLNLFTEIEVTIRGLLDELRASI